MKGKGSFFKTKSPMVKTFRIAYFLLHHNPCIQQDNPNSHHLFPYSKNQNTGFCLEKQMVLGAGFQNWKQLWIQ